MNANRIAHLTDALHVLNVLEAMGVKKTPISIPISQLRWLIEQARENAKRDNAFPPPKPPIVFKAKDGAVVYSYHENP